MSKSTIIIEATRSRHTSSSSSASITDEGTESSPVEVSHAYSEGSDEWDHCDEVEIEPSDSASRHPPSRKGLRVSYERTRPGPSHRDSSRRRVVVPEVAPNRHPRPHLRPHHDHIDHHSNHDRRRHEPPRSETMDPDQDYGAYGHPDARYEHPQHPHPQWHHGPYRGPPPPQSPPSIGPQSPHPQFAHHPHFNNPAPIPPPQPHPNRQLVPLGLHDPYAQYGAGMYQPSIMSGPSSGYYDMRQPAPYAMPMGYPQAMSYFAPNPYQVPQAIPNPSPPATTTSDDAQASYKELEKLLKQQQEGFIKAEADRVAREKDREAKIEQEKKELAAKAARDAAEKKAAEDVASAAKKAKEAAEAEAAAKTKEMSEAHEKAKKEAIEAHEKATKEALEAHEKAMAEAKAAMEKAKEAEKVAKEEAKKLKPPDDAKQLPIKFKDAFGRKFVFPWRVCKTWDGMERLIKQAFDHIDGIGKHVHERHYDLTGPNGDIILPEVWESSVHPDWSITMHMWPMAEPPKKEAPPPPPPPPPPAPPAPVTVLGPAPTKSSSKSGGWFVSDKKAKSKRRPSSMVVPPPPPPPPPPPAAPGAPPPPPPPPPAPPTAAVVADPLIAAGAPAVVVVPEKRRKAREPQLSPLFAFAAGGRIRSQSLKRR